ncbi:RraA family protein [Rouxiella badensis]|jgi:regulator of RNase E activity RraA|uniref:Putative 4-hydroxy-4-methyl-2-oxoglutarate aldolase n=1 Tax=Rouxiella badensis TaxID=1646377 RepID=A0A1X0WA87_9GAMM|nr:RraA family protein [Rouxiella badensis]MCC3704303.1 RraA family protein [Rouxiella badensis]MCC3720798.1 RraA family protein [Rouxiella badensis]MCC3730637.1 RraA family protein [Rouxiella badensis]MCC3741865.1 RraA family protein [Rouxiella badensis]MCC3749361.1 RraA family protein [Rouxiella badensis]
MTSRSEWPAGYFIGQRDNVPDSATIEAFRRLPVPNIGDTMGRSTAALGLQPYHADNKVVLCGPALTVKVRPGDNLMIHKAIEMAQPGDVIVVDGSGDLTQALIGGLMRTSALTKKIAGFVIDGAIRDLNEWAEGGIAVFARGNTLRGPSKDGPGKVNVPISCAGLLVNPGDLIVGDADGVIAIPYEELQDLLPKVQKHAEREEQIRAHNASGTTDPERFNSLLRSKGCPV